MSTGTRLNLKEHVQGGGWVHREGISGWQLEIPSGSAGSYRLAQLDDYGGLVRGAFPWTAPIRLSLAARTSTRTIPGTWGFGLWNDPFGMALVQGSKMRFPTLPNAAWYFFASASNYLSLRDDLPANGQLAATFHSPSNLPFNLVLGLPLLPLVFIPPFARRLRRWFRQYIQQDTAAFDLDPTEWHTYEIEWQLERVVFLLDGQKLQETKINPRGPLGLVIWVDNQYARWLPDGRIRYGTLENRETGSLQVDDLKLTLA
ncbi:MAG: family 16 glycosylhydrolase [Anaerolineales bacterium]